MEAKVRFEVLSNLSNETLEGGLADEEVGGFLIATDLTESDGSWAVTVGLLDAFGGGGGLASGLGGELLAGGFAPSGPAGSLLGTGHLWCCVRIVDPSKEVPGLCPLVCARGSAPRSVLVLVCEKAHSACLESALCPSVVLVLVLLVLVCLCAHGFGTADCEKACSACLPRKEGSALRREGPAEGPHPTCIAPKRAQGV